MEETGANENVMIIKKIRRLDRLGFNSEAMSFVVIIFMFTMILTMLSIQPFLKGKLTEESGLGLHILV